MVAESCGICKMAATSVWYMFSVQEMLGKMTVKHHVFLKALETRKLWVVEELRSIHSKEKATLTILLLTTQDAIRSGC
jgi:hypothetical protein